MKRLQSFAIARATAVPQSSAYTYSLPLPRITPVMPAGRRVRVPVSGVQIGHVTLSSSVVGLDTAGASVGDASNLLGSAGRHGWPVVCRAIPYPLRWLATRLPTADASGVIVAIRGGHAAGTTQHDDSSIATASCDEWNGETNGTATGLGR